MEDEAEGSVEQPPFVLDSTQALVEHPGCISKAVEDTVECPRVIPVTHDNESAIPRYNLIDVTAEIHDNVGDQPRQRIAINNSKLNPHKLLTLKVKVGETSVLALLDTGASNNLIKASVCTRLKLEINREKKSNICGLVMRNSSTLGRTCADITYYGIVSRNTGMHVVEDKLMDSDMILGRQFCEKNKIVIDLGKRCVSKVTESQSRVSIYHNDDNEIIKVIQEDLIAEASEDTKLDDGLTPVKIKINCIGDITEGCEYLYEGACKDRRLEGMDGVVDSNGEMSVLIKSNERKTVKKGENIGRVTTLVSLNPDDDLPQESWSMEQLQEKAHVGAQLSAQERT